MAVFIDPRTGKRYENVPDKDAALAQSKFGFVSEADYATQQAEDQKPLLDKAGDAVVAGLQAGARTAMAPGMALQEALTGTLSGATPQSEVPADQQSALGEGVFSPEARARAEQHPIAAGIGQTLAAAPYAALAGAVLPEAAAGAGLLARGGAAAGGALAESAPQAVAQEYDDSWLEQRPATLANVAAYTLMFAGGDLLFRGALKTGKSLLFGPGESTVTSLGGRNLVSEAQGAARELDPSLAPAGGGGSVGAASAENLSEPFDNAIRTMKDKDAMVLARDAEDHLHLAAQNSSEAFTRVNQGLSDNLGSQLKYEDFATNAQKWDAPQLERQAKWLAGVTTDGEQVARGLNAFAEGDATAPDLGNLGKKAVRIIDSFNQRIVSETDPARRNWLVDAYKKQLDSYTMSVDASFGIDAVTRTDLKKAIAPLREGLRSGLENPKYWGENAVIQKSLNGPWHQLLKDWPAVQRMVLEATGHTEFDQMGAGRITRESTVDRMLSLLGKDPRSNQEFGKHLAGAFDGLQGLIEARQAHGIAGTEGLEAMASDVRNLMEDWNLAQTVGVAKNRVAIMQRDPRKWAKLALDFGEHLPVVGRPLQGIREVAGALSNDLHLEKGTPIAAVWDRAYQRYALNPAMQDPSIARNYSDWVLEALGQRGGSVPPAGAMGAPAAPMANDVMTGVPGFRQAAQPSQSLFTRPGAAAVPLAAGAGAALAAQGQANAAEPAPPPAQAPDHTYRDALREIDKAGDAHLAELASSATRKRAPAASSKGPLELFSGRRSLQDAVAASRDRIAEVANDPAALVKVLGGSVGDLWKTHPGVYGAMVQKAQQLAGYLQQNAPQPAAVTLLDPRGGAISFDRAWDYAARYIGAAQPKVAMREVVRGTAPPEMIEALQANWKDELWDPFKAHMLGQVQRMAAAGRHIPSEKLRRWDSMLGMDGQLDPSASLAVASHFLAAQDAEAQKRQQAGQKRGGGAASSAAAAGMQTRLGAINAERQMQ